MQFEMEENGSKESKPSPLPSTLPPSSLLPPPPPPPPPPFSSAPSEDEVDKFYALLENIRAVRDVWSAGNANKKPKMEENPRAGSDWTPTFEWEDFQLGEQSKSDTPKEGDQGDQRSSTSSMDLKPIIR